MAKYSITVRTSSKEGAGTDSDIEMKLVGTLGETGWTNLDEAGNSFEAGDINIFFFDFNDIGTPSKVRLRTREESTNPDSPAWHLDRVCVYPGKFLKRSDSCSSLTSRG